MRFLFLITLFHLACISLMSMSVYPQSFSISFYNNGMHENVDYHSFHPALLLRHTIENRFHKLPKNPILSPSRGDWDRKDAADPFVFVSADSIMLFYDGDDNDRYHIGYAVRDNTGWFWEKKGIILNGSGARWDSYHQIAPVVLEWNNTRYLYYNGNAVDEELGYQWGLAVRNPGEDWTYPKKSPLIELDTTDWDFSGNAYGDILYFPEENKFKMWFTGFQGPVASIGLAESGDGIHWQKMGEMPVLALLPGVISPDVVFNGESYTMYFVQLSLGRRGMSTKICRAESEDGIHWRNIEDVLVPEARWEGKRLMRPNLSYFEGRVQLYYCAARGGDWRIGVAYAEAKFESKGTWRSLPQSGIPSELQIKYELPAETSLRLKLLNARGESYPLTLDANKNFLRKDVYRSSVPFPENLSRTSGSSQEWQLEIHLETANPGRSPVVYEIKAIL